LMEHDIDQTLIALECERRRKWERDFERLPEVDQNMIALRWERRLKSLACEVPERGERTLVDHVSYVRERALEQKQVYAAATAIAMMKQLLLDVEPHAVSRGMGEFHGEIEASLERFSAMLELREQAIAVARETHRGLLEQMDRERGTR